MLHLKSILIILIVMFFCKCIVEGGDIADNIIDDNNIEEMQQCILNGSIINDRDLEKDYGRSIVGLSSANDSYSLGTGILIAPRLVLTAGHCGTNECSFVGTKRNFVVRIGINSKDPIEEIPVMFEVKHPDFGRNNPNIGLPMCNKNNNSNCCNGAWGIDLGVWVLERAPKYAKPYSKIGTVSKGDNLIFLGFGSALQNSQDSGYLRKTTTIVNDITSNAMQGNPPFANGGSRIYLSNEKDICSEGGDSGGPYFNKRGDLVAIHSGSFQDIDMNIAQSIYPYIDWINNLKSLFCNE